jgi:hypothetical protein
MTPGTAPGRLTWADGEAPAGCWTNWVTDDATCFDASGAVEFPANADAAAISNDAALEGSAAAF